MNKIFATEFTGYDIGNFATVIISTNKEHAIELFIEKIMLTHKNVDHNYVKEQILVTIFEIDINKCGVDVLFDGYEFY